MIFASLLLAAALNQTPDGGVSPLDDLHWRPQVDLFAEYQWQQARGAPAFNAFNVPRAQLGVEAEWRGVIARVLFEGVYSTQGGALIGTAGDSIVARLREGWGGYQWRFLEARAGMVPTLAVPALEKAWGLRAVAADALESQQLMAPADLGAWVKATLPFRLGWLGAAVSNGEGYTQRELDARKTVELALLIHPVPAWQKLAALVAYQNGTTGTASLRADRFGGGLWWDGPRLGLGANAFWLAGFSDDGGRRGVLVQVYARATLFDRLLLGARAHWLDRDLAGTANNSIVDVTGSVGVRIAEPLELFAVLHRALPSALARNALPGSDLTELRLTLRVRWPRSGTPEPPP